MPVSHRVLLVSVLSLGFICSFLFLFDNTDRETRSIMANDGEIMMFAASNLELSQSIAEDEAKKGMKFEEFTTSQRMCLKDPHATGSTKEQLESFVEGECNPVIVLPGIFGTRLVAEIDCPVLQEKNPEVMDACGWTTCSSWNPFGKKPDTEYVIWIPKWGTPMALISRRDFTYECFGSIFGNTYDSNKMKTRDRFTKVEGVSITWYGNSPKTYYDAAAGFTAVSNILPNAKQDGVQDRAYAGLDEYFTQMGYQKGLSLFAVPYDFRLTQLAGSVHYTLERTIRYAYELTGKKVVIVAHSLGNINTLPVLLKMNQTDKDRMIATYVAVTPPYGGSSKSVRCLMGGDENTRLKDLIGVHFPHQWAVWTSAPSIYDLMPGDGFFRFRNEPWMKEMLQRVNLENKYNINTEEGARFWNNANKSELPLSYFPNPSEVCFEGFSLRPKECRTLITDMGVQPIVEILGEKFYANTTNIEYMLKKYFYIGEVTTALQSYKNSRDNGIQEFANPKVPVIYVYGSHLSTEMTIEWDYDPGDSSVEYDFNFPSKTIKKYGDTTVGVSYSLPIALKWAWEHRNGVTGAKPIKVVEYCSNYNLKDSVWDTTDNKTGARVMSKTEYMGKKCSCSPGNINCCDHASILTDTYFIDLVADAAHTKQTTKLENTAAYKLSDEYLTELIDLLPHLRKPRNEQDVKKWLY